MATQEWQGIDSAPRSKVVIIRTARGRVFKAEFKYGPVVDGEEREVWAWIASDEGIHPECWTDGVCWEVNAEGEESDQPTHWIPMPDPPETEPK